MTEQISFTELLASARKSDQNAAWSIPDHWMQGRTTYGGLSAALCYAAVENVITDLPPLRSAMVTFVGPAAGEVHSYVKVLRRGKSALFVEADLHSDKGLATRAQFVFGEARESAFDFTACAAPDVPGPDAAQDCFKGGRGPAFAANFELRLAQGAMPMAGSEISEHYFWARHRDREAKGIAALLAAADMPPPAVMPMFKTFGPISSVTWQLNFLTSLPVTRDDWWLLQSKAENAVEGYSSQDMTIWNLDRTPIATCRQCVAIFV